MNDAYLPSFLSRGKNGSCHVNRIFIGEKMTELVILRNLLIIFTVAVIVVALLH